ncbi:MAG: MFS transporter [Gammaproteobacteria bacterium]|nr:MAG: MFS transporter [Gammaproteobacteria bacterium]
MNKRPDESKICAFNFDIQHPKEHRQGMKKRGGNKNPMTSLERRAVSALAGVFGLRMLGLFLILPVFALYAEELEGNTAFLTGVAIGAYGLTQAIFQIPFGLMSDKLGRKRVIAAGLLIFAIGSVVAAMADSITGVILGRALQGTGAIAAAVIAFASDLTREEQRTKAMAIIGMTIGLAFFVAIILAPVLDRSIGVPGIFWLTAVLAIAAIVIVYKSVPTPVASHVPLGGETSLKKQFSIILKDIHLLRLDYGIFSLHLVLMAFFVAVPFSLVESLDIQRESHGSVYLSVVLLSVVAMAPLVMMTTRKKRIPNIFLAGIVLLLVGELMFAFSAQSKIWFLAGMVIWFTGFNTLESLMPSLVSRLAPVQNKGAAIGIYNSAEFFGAFLGGVLGGLVLGISGTQGVYIMSAGVIAVWLLIMLPAKPPKLLDTRVLRFVDLESQGNTLAAELSTIEGVLEVIIMAPQGVVYLKVDSELLLPEALDKYETAADI